MILRLKQPGSPPQLSRQTAFKMHNNCDDDLLDDDGEGKSWGDPTVLSEGFREKGGGKTLSPFHLCKKV